MDYSQRAGIDLHIHSNASDGTLTPSEILKLALDLNLRAISITDHDTVSGAKEALRIGIPSDIKFLTGVEISATPPPSFDCPGSFHILGYGINLEDPFLNRTLDKLQNARKNRNPLIIERLNSLGIDITLEDVHQNAGNGQLGRPHIARTMIQKGYAKSIDDAFDNFLGKGNAAYVDKFRLDSSQAIELINHANGIPVLAHPYLLDFKNSQVLETLIETLAHMGLKGLEVYYPTHSPDHVVLYKNLAKRYRLIVTGGTDFHGKLKPEIQIGSGSGDFFVPYEIYEDLARVLQAA